MDNFQFQIIATERCNLRCSYCYMDDRKKSMSKETFDAHYKFLPEIMESYGSKKYSAVFFGGEPLMNWELIEYAVPKLLFDRNCNSIVLVTNGLKLTKEKREFLYQYNVRISISFDGLWNKEQRKLSSGESSFDKYMDLKDELDIKGCKVMVSPSRNTTMVENYEWFVEDFGVPSPDFTIVRDDIWSDEDVEKFKTELVDLTDRNIKYIKDGVHSLVGFYNLYFLDTYLATKYGKRKFGCFSGHRGLGFMPDGKVYPCARFGNNKEYEIWDSMKRSRNDYNYRTFLNSYIIDPSWMIECDKCRIKKFCNAGCTYSQLEMGKKIHKEELCSPVPNVCKLLLSLYDETGRLVKEVGESDLFKKIIKNSMECMG